MSPGGRVQLPFSTTVSAGKVPGGAWKDECQSFVSMWSLLRLANEAMQTLKNMKNIENAH